MQDEKMIQHFTNAVLGILNLVSETSGRESSVELLRRVNRQFEASGNTSDTTTPSEATEPAMSKFDTYLASGGYDLTDRCVMVAKSGKAQLARAFGILPAAGSERPEPMLGFLLVGGDEVFGTAREFCRHSYNPRPAYGKPDQSIILFHTPEQRMSPHDFNLLIDNLNAAGVTTLADAFSRLNPFPKQD